MGLDLDRIEAPNAIQLNEDASPDVAVAAPGVVHRSGFDAIGDIGGVDEDRVVTSRLHPLHDQEQGPQFGSRHGLLARYPREDASDPASVVAHNEDTGGDDSRPLLRLRSPRSVGSSFGRTFEELVEVTDDRGAAQRLFLPSNWLAR